MKRPSFYAGRRPQWRVARPLSALKTEPKITINHGLFFVIPTEKSSKCDANQSDFYLYYQTFKSPDGKKFRLQTKSDNKRTPEFENAFLNQLFENPIVADLLSSQDASCGAAGFGKGNGSEEPPA
ncbi:MAG: hypothetical protein JWM21_4639 [Acidobacteria bacterium]|nr:hypothetical protein [Acidobacteriota bacterium]